MTLSEALSNRAFLREGHAADFDDLSGNDGGLRVYHQDHESMPGGSFLVLEWVACDGDAPKWGPGSVVKVVAHGSAAFDGVRHIWWANETEDGYLYYPDLVAIERLMGFLRERFPDRS